MARWVGPWSPVKGRDLIRQDEPDNQLWGAPHIPGELLKFGIEISGTSVAKYMVQHRKPPSQTWHTFLNNHIKNLVSARLLYRADASIPGVYVFLVLAHDRRRVVHFNVTAHPTAEWTARQLREAFLFDQIPKYLLRDRDKIFGEPAARKEHADRGSALCSAITAAAGLH